MTGGFLSFPIMRPKQCRTVLHVSILAALLLNLNADSEDSDCEVQMKVRRNTVYKVFLGDVFWMKCPVGFCNNSPPTVSWFKIEENDVPVNVSSSSHIKTGWESFNHSEGVSYLVFQNIFTSDSGMYSCRSEGSKSHYINISVYVRDDEHTNVTKKNDTSGTHVDPENLWMYMYTVAGIVAFVIIVIVISVASMQGCKGKSKTEIQTENQYMAIPMVEQPFPHASLQPSPRGSPSAPPSRRSTRREQPSQPTELPLPRDSERLYSRIKGDRDRKRNTGEEEESSVVYASLNHQLPVGVAARPRRPQEDFSEYAAIRVQDPKPTRH